MFNYRKDMEQFVVITTKDGSRYLARRYFGQWEDMFLIEQL